MKTTDKGDIGVAKCIADLLSQGLEILMPYAAASPFDLVVKQGLVYSRVQVKYRAVNAIGSLHAPLLRASFGLKSKPKTYTNTEIDVVCVYCPDTDECYYVSPKASISLRVTPAKNNQAKGVVMAQDHRKFPVTE
jgi:hypothetical protein